MNDEDFTLEDVVTAAFEEAPPEAEETVEEEVSEDLTPPNDDTPPEETAESEEGDLEAKLQELEQEFGVTGDDPFADVKAQEQWLSQEEASLIQEQAELKAGFLNGLPVITNDEGVSIYTMKQDQFDKFLQELGDDGKESLKIEAAQARARAVEEATKHLKRQEDFQNRLREFSTVKEAIPMAKQQVEVIADLSKRLGLPDLIQKYKTGEVKKVLEAKAQTDPSIAPLMNSKEGLYKLGLLAVRELGLVPSKNEISETPSAPDAKAGSKKVRTKVTPDSPEALLAKASEMSDKEFAKLPEETRERLLYASISSQLF